MNRMINNVYRYCFCICALVAVSIANTSASAQTGISYMNNGIRVGDSIPKQQVEYFYAEEIGDDVVWHISDLELVRPYTVQFFTDSDSIDIRELTPEYINTYAFREDTLMLTGSETSLEKISYTQPVPLLAYPFYHMDTFETPYSGTGLYCQTHNIDKNGFINIEADSWGTLILNDDTLRNTIRIHSIRTGATCMYDEDDSLEIRTERMKQEIEERYQWYAKGYRYPILETISTSYYDNMDLVSCVQKAFCYAPDLQSLLVDKTNEDIRYADSIAEAKTKQPDIMQYTVITSGSQINISYSLTEDARISILVCNQMGMLYRRESFSMPAGEGYSQTVDCTGLLPGTYILYLNVNGKVYTEKVKL